jgi:hypothetical protein
LFDDTILVVLRFNKLQGKHSYCVAENHFSESRDW